MAYGLGSRFPTVFYKAEPFGKGETSNRASGANIDFLSYFTLTSGD